MNLDHSADVLIVGGGLVGATQAIALGQAGLSVLVVDRLIARGQLDEGFDGRASAIAQAPKRMLERLGVWQHLTEATPILDIRVADGDSLLFLHYDHQEIGDQPLGYMVENRHMRQALFARLAELTSVRYLAPAEINDITRDENNVRVRLKDGVQLRAALIIGADGRSSQVREHAKIPLTRWSYDQTGIVCTIAHEKPHNNVAHEHFYPSGPFAILPISGNRSSIVWTERDKNVPGLMALDDAAFTKELAARFGDFMGDLKLNGPRWSYPLDLQFARNYSDKRLAVVGDAAHGMHPIAGQGLNVGLRDVAALAEVLIDAHRLGLDIGASHVLRGYDQWRRFDTTVMLALTDGLNRLFSNDLAPVRLARDVGLAAVNKSGPLKKVFMRHAMGAAGRLPKLLKGEAV
ncbi:MAG: 2-octaprenyl-6-methoxyphenyl hydroxylase [Rhodospirillales bacterium]|nr:2-octaprenyl-6-methoxyphenyl hydroxylase [Rhodospirillales bacterium]